MADEQHRWLDRATAERLLRGEPLDTVDAAAREQAERLAKALNALSVKPSGAEAELPGEAAALAAFRKAHAERADAQAGFAPSDSSARTRSDDAGVVHIGSRGGRTRRARRGRSVRLALSAALAAGAVGGVAAAATTGVLPTPFGDDEPGPAASVTAPATPGRPLDPSSPGGGPGSPGPGGPTAGVTGGARDTTGGATPGRDSVTGSDHSMGRGRGGLVSACRDLRDGRGLGADRRRALEGAAGGSSRVWTYCEGVLKVADTRSEGTGGTGTGNGNSNGNGTGTGTGNGTGNGNGTGTGTGNGNGNGNGNGTGNGQDQGQGQNGGDEGGQGAHGGGRHPDGGKKSLSPAPAAAPARTPAPSTTPATTSPAPNAAPRNPS
ncbi:extensin [Streptomyces sp. NPDC096152]|uniref:extensin n=1 Tax=Streptomyces sp. NPDC096152 TaxID=3366078 RepID=UPI0037FA7933